MEEIREVDAETQKEGIDGSGPSASNGDGVDSKRVTGPTRKSPHWTTEEDKILEDAVKRFGGKCWKKIGKFYFCFMLCAQDFGYFLVRPLVQWGLLCFGYQNLLDCM
ncbi:unnamed protein product [Ilex paraguariensis]|uniref:Uncharacterized protein n=1 Tax=Ilex paraguariensis TaxID=185542 RepID=A0ABC8QP25_9AQUA